MRLERSLKIVRDEKNTSKLRCTIIGSGVFRRIGERD